MLQADYAHHVSVQKSIPRHQYPLLDYTLKMVLCIQCVKEGTGTQNLYKTLTTSTLFSTFQTWLCVSHTKQPQPPINQTYSGSHIAHSKIHQLPNHAACCLTQCQYFKTTEFNLSNQRDSMHCTIISCNDFTAGDVTWTMIGLVNLNCSADVSQCRDSP